MTPEEPEKENPTPSAPASKGRIVAMPLDQARRARGQARVAMPRSKVASLRAFRRVRADRVAGLIGLMLLLVGVAAAFYWEKPLPVEKKFSVTWPTTIVGCADDQFRLTPGGEREVPCDVKGPNVTAISFRIMVQDDVGDEPIEADNISYEVTDPAGKSRGVNYVQQLVANFTTTLILSTIPDISSVPAKTEDEARAGVGDQTNRTGEGKWTARVKLLNARHNYQNHETRDLPCETQTAYCQPDTGQTVTFRFEYVTYRVAFEKNF